MTLPDPGMWTTPAALCCEVAAGNGPCCASDADIIRYATDLLVRAYGLRFSAGYERITERIAPASRLDDWTVLPLGGAAPWPVVEVETVRINGLAIPPSLWRLESEHARVRRLPDPYAPYGELASGWPDEWDDFLRSNPQARRVGVDTPLGVATTIAVDDLHDGAFSFTLVDFAAAIPASADALVLTASEGTEWVVPLRGLTGAAPTFGYQASWWGEGPLWPSTVPDNLQVAQGWLLDAWTGVSGRPEPTPPANLVVTVAAREYVLNPRWQGPTVQVTYRAGMLPPSGPTTCARLACELRKLMCPTAESAASCGLPAGSSIRSVSRQGLSLQLDDQQVKEGLLGWDQAVDAAIRDYRLKNGSQPQGPVAVWAPNRSDRNAIVRW